MSYIGRATHASTLPWSPISPVSTSSSETGLIAKRPGYIVAMTSEGGRTVLLLGDRDEIPEAIHTALKLAGCRVRHELTAFDTEGIGVDVVLASSGRHITEVMVHPKLHDRPVVLLSGERFMQQSIIRLVQLKCPAADAPQQVVHAVMGAARPDMQIDALTEAESA